MSLISNKDEFLYVEKYRPAKIDDCILPERLKKTLMDIVKQGEIPNMLFAGGAGIGKTTVSFALCNELDADVLFINASMESGIDVLRSKIQSFASTVSFGGGTKIVILDEADGLNCLEENETVRIGTVEDWSAIPLKDLDPNLEHSVVSFNMETGKFENDTATVISNSSKETFELELETGETVIVTGDHPFIVTQDEKTFIERTINEGLEGYKIVCYNLKFVNVKSIKPTGVRTVINLTVNKNHTFVTGNGIVTHNCNSFQPALRGFIETFSANCRFILTCNFPQKLIEPIHSRCTVINFAIDKNEKQEIAARFFKRACGILTEEKVEFDQKVVAEVVTKYFPDYRRVLNELQRYSVSGKIDSGILSNFTDDSYKALIGFLKDKNFTEVRKWVGSNEVDTVPLFRYLYDYSNTLIETNSIPQLILIMADYSYKSAFVADQELNVMAALTEIMSSVVFK